MDPQHWMHRNRAAKPLSLSAKLAAMTAERDALLKRVEAGEKLAEALLAVEWDFDRCSWCQSYESIGHEDDCQRQQALAAWRAADVG